MSKLILITDIIERQIPKDDTIPESFVRGRLKK